MIGKSSLVLVVLLAFTACHHSVDNKQTYGLCPKSKESRPKLLELMRRFAAENRAILTDRGSEAESELSRMHNGSALSSTGGDLVVLTVEKPNDLHISLSNLGLAEKFGMAVSHQNIEQKDPRITWLMAAIEQSWIVQRADDGLGNAPPCKPAQ